MHLKTTFKLMLALLVAGLPACYESPDITMHEPGDYKGAKDPLLQTQRSAQQQQQLRERFNLVQTDR